MTTHHVGYLVYLGECDPWTNRPDRCVGSGIDVSANAFDGHRDTENIDVCPTAPLWNSSRAVTDLRGLFLARIVEL